MFASYYNCVIYFICCFNPQYFNSSIVILIEDIESYTVKRFLYDFLYAFFQQTILSFCHFTLKYRVLDSLPIIHTCLCHMP